MKTPNVLVPAIIVSAAVLLSGCGKAGPAFEPGAPSGPMEAQTSHHGGAQPAMCPSTPTLWVSSLANSTVYGYIAANASPCVSLNGTYNGLPLHAPYGLAIDPNPPHNLYAADLTNNRIVVFDSNGNYVKWLDTKLGGNPYAPWGVCVSSTGVVGVGTIWDAGQGNVEFFAPNAASGSLPTGDATGTMQRQTWRAFDSAGNFFVEEGTNSGTSQIDYLPSSDVNVAGQTLVNAGLGSAPWVGMYSRVNSPADQTISVAKGSVQSGTQRVYTWSVSGPPAGPLTFTPCACSPYAFHQYPHSDLPVEQVAPSTGGASGVLFLAEYGKHSYAARSGKVLQGPANGGAVAIYESVHGAVGIATNPSGQY